MIDFVGMRLQNNLFARIAIADTENYFIGGDKRHTPEFGSEAVVIQPSRV